MFGIRVRQRPTCHACGGRGITYQSISPLGGAMARRPCRRCDGRGVR